MELRVLEDVLHRSYPGIHGDISQQGNMRLRENLPDQMKGGQRDKGIPQAAYPVNHDPLALTIFSAHDGLSCGSGSV